MKRLIPWGFLFSILLPGFMMAGMAQSSPREQYLAASDLIKQDPKAGYEAMQDLASAGYPRAYDRLGYFNVKGLGVPADLSQALTFYELAVEQGYSKSLVSMAKVLAKLERHKDAITALEQAIDLEIRNAEVTLASLNATGKLGALSDRDAGWTKLLELANAGDRSGEIGLVYVASATGREFGNSEQILSSLAERARTGDGRAAEMLLRYFRMSGANGSADLNHRKELLGSDSIRDRVRAEEGLYIAVKTQAPTFWLASEDIVSEVQGKDRARAMVVTARLNKNAYVRLLQKELSGMGYKTGRATGYLNRATIRAVNQFCRDTGITASCAVGPLKGSAIKAITNQLAGS